MNKPKIIEGGFFEDNRGEMRFVNEFKFTDIVRFYFIKHITTDIIRAWQGHRYEQKYFYLISGSFVIAWIKIDNFEKPSPDLIPEYHIVTSKKSELIYIPKGYANGIRALTPNSELMIFSDTEVEQSVKDKIRYNSSLWFDWTNLKPK